MSMTETHAWNKQLKKHIIKINNHKWNIIRRNSGFIGTANSHVHQHVITKRFINNAGSHATDITNISKCIWKSKSFNNNHTILKTFSI
jgi:hypothetical protein